MSSELNQEKISTALQSVQNPHTGKSFYESKYITNVQVDGEHLSFELTLPYPAHPFFPSIRAEFIKAIQPLDGIKNVSVNITTKIIAHAAQRGVQLLPSVKNIIAVASGKGGVGKSTTAVNIALALAKLGANVGVLDADIYGPSVPMMLGLSGKPLSEDGKTMLPMLGHGIQAMSIGLLVKEDDAMIWRGPMATQALEQLLRQTHWQDLDYLIVDMPPGTGDIQLTLSQRVPLTGAVIVTTPQDIALLDAKKGIRMFEKVNVPILGLVENMANHICSQCGHVEPIFGMDGGRNMAEAMGINFLGTLPLSKQIREHADSGAPSVAADPEGAIAKTYVDIALKLAVQVAARAKDYSTKIPSIKVSNDT